MGGARSGRGAPVGLDLTTDGDADRVERRARLVIARQARVPLRSRSNGKEGKTMAASKSAKKKSAAAKKGGAAKASQGGGKAPSKKSLAVLGDVTGSEEAFERFKAEAGALQGPLVGFRADVRLAYYNANRGVEALLERRAQIEKDLPGISMGEVEAIPALALGAVFAASRAAQAQAQGADEPSISTMLMRARDLRALMLSSAESLVRAGLLPERAVEKIRQGRGAMDAAQDCVDLAALFRSNAGKLRGKTPVSAANLAEAANVGSELLTMLKPKAARSGKGAGKELMAAVDMRDRFWTMLVRRYEKARRAGVWLWGEAEVDEHVPLLQSRVAAPRKATPGSDAAAPAEGGGG